MSTLSTEQVLLLDTIMYLNGVGAPVENFEGQTVADWVNSIDTSKLTNEDDLTTGTEWKQVINAIKSDPELGDMRIVSTHIDNGDGGGGGMSALFVNDSTKEAVVSFRGTASNEWKDNFVGGYQTDTAQQKNALNWYKDTYAENNLDDYYVTVTGHSKGGNKAKYVTILDDSVDRCLSFDGQGFSDEFIDKYESQIGANQSKISNHNTDKDYVNILLNDVGDTTYYEGQHYGEGKLLEAHCPETMLKFNEDGSVSMIVSPDGQYQPMKDLDKFLNGYLRTLSPEDKKNVLNFFGDIAQAVRNKASADEIKAILMNPRYREPVTNMLAYTIKYSQEDPGLINNVNLILSQLGLDAYVEYVDTFQSVLGETYDFGIFGSCTLYDILEFVLPTAGGILSNFDWLFNKVVEILMDKLKISREEAEALLDAICKTVTQLDDVEVNYDGKDRQVKSTSFGGVGFIKEDSSALLSTASVLHGCSSSANNLLDEYEKTIGKIKFSAVEVLACNLVIKAAFYKLAKNYSALGNALEESALHYDQTEQRIVDEFSI